MRKALSVLIAGAGLSLAPLTPALADNPSPSTLWVRVDPASAAQGGMVRVTANCPGDSGKVTTSGEVSSPAFSTTPLQLASDGTRFADVRVSSSISPNSYAVNLNCPDGKNTSTTLTVYAVPSKAGPATGGGYLSKDNSAPLVISGAILATAGVGVGFLALRRRPTS